MRLPTQCEASRTGFRRFWLGWILAPCLAVTLVADDLDDALREPSNWVHSFEARAWSGFKDNVLLGNRNRVESPFAAGGLDMMLYRLPIDGWEGLFLSSVEYLRYFKAQEVEHEATALVQGQGSRTFGDRWKSGLSAEYLYFDQVFDATTFEEIFQAVHVEGHGLTLRPSLSKELGAVYKVELELPATRQFFAEFIDDYWELGPKLILAREYGRKSGVTLSYQFIERTHDTRAVRDREGAPDPGRSLRFDQHDFGLMWRHYWDAERRWRTTTRLGLLRNEDNGGGFYNYVRPYLSEQLRFQAASWGAVAEARVSHYRYDHQRVGAPDATRRERTSLRLNFRGEKTLVKALKLYAQYEHERAYSNLEFDRYAVNTVSAGLSWEF